MSGQYWHHKLDKAHKKGERSGKEGNDENIFYSCAKCNNEEMVLKMKQHSTKKFIIGSIFMIISFIHYDIKDLLR